MQLTRALGTVAAFTAFAAALMLTTMHPARSTDLEDSQTLVNHPATDITDVYAFPAQDNPANVVLVMNTNPLIPSGQGPGTSFDPSVLYQFQISHGSAGVVDTVIQFVPTISGTGQSLTMYGPAAPNANSPSVSTVVPSTASSMIPYNKSTSLTITDAAGKPAAIQVFAGPRSDPDFFDLSRFYAIFPDANYQNHQSTSVLPAPSPSPITFGSFGTNSNACDTSNTAVDFFASGKYNVLSIIVEMPKTALADEVGGGSSNTVNIWATTSTASGV